MSTPKFWRSTITGASMPTEPADLPEPVAYRHEHEGRLHEIEAALIAAWNALRPNEAQGRP